MLSRYGRCNPRREWHTKHTHTHANSYGQIVDTTRVYLFWWFFCVGIGHFGSIQITWLCYVDEFRYIVFVSFPSLPNLLLRRDSATKPSSGVFHIYLSRTPYTPARSHNRLVLIDKTANSTHSTIFRTRLMKFANVNQYGKELEHNVQKIS